MRIKICYLFLGVFILVHDNIQAQLNKQDNTVSYYYNHLGDQSALLNGTKYLGYPNYFKEGTPFYIKESLQIGSIVYDHIKFEQVQFQYDLVADAIIIQDSTHRIQLINEKIEKFTIQNEQFIRIEKDSLLKVLPSSGFYNLRYNGNIKFFIKYMKTKVESIVNVNELTGRFEPSSYYFIQKNNNYYSVSSKKDLFNLFKDKKSKIIPFAKALKFKYRKDPENFILKIATYYDQL